MDDNSCLSEEAPAPDHVDPTLVDWQTATQADNAQDHASSDTRFGMKHRRIKIPPLRVTSQWWSFTLLLP